MGMSEMEMREEPNLEIRPTPIFVPKPPVEDEVNAEEEDYDVIEADHGEEELDTFLTESTTKQNSLISSSIPAGDETLSTNAFVEEFYKRYGPLIPLFYVGTLEGATKEALLCPAKDRKLLGIYLHSDKNVTKHIFCSQTLCDENVVNFLSTNFVVWPWDLTNKEHENHFFEIISKHLGNGAASHLRNSRNEYPLFLVINRVRSSNEIISVIEGDVSNDNMLQRIMQAFEMFELNRVKDEIDEQNRDEREKIKREQDMAYQMSLDADKKKREAQDAETQKLKEEAAFLKKAETEKQLLKEKRIKDCFNSLPQEPYQSTPSKSITTIRFRLPNGQILIRKFNINNTLKDVINFVISNGYFDEEYKVLSSWPRRDLTNESPERTLEEMKLFPQETLTLEQR